MRALRRPEAVAAALVVLVVVGVAVAIDLGRGPDRSAPPVGGSWRELAPMPIAARWSPVAVWTGSEVLVVGGGVGTPCPPSASCAEPDPMASDGAAYDPVSDTWRRIADAPVAVGYWFRAAYVADRLVLSGDDQWWAYDPRADAWTDLPEPPQRLRDTGDLTASGDGFVYALARRDAADLWALNVARASWAQVPLGSPGDFQRETVVGPLLFSGRSSGAGSDRVVVDLGEGRLVETGQTTPFRHWTGERLVELDLEVSSGGLPGGGRLDPATGEWSPLPDAPDLEADRGDGWYPQAAAGPLLAGWGYVYDDRTGTWTTLGRPHDTPVDDHQSAVWADGTLVLVGGIDAERGYEDVDGISDGAWAWTP